MDKQESDGKRRERPLIPGATSHVAVPLNRKMRRAQRYGHVLKPEHNQAGYNQRVHRTQEEEE